MLNLGKRKTRRAQPSAAGVRQLSSHHDRYSSRPASIVRVKTPYDVHCSNQDCQFYGEVNPYGSDGLVRFRLGYVLYRRNGPMMVPVFYMTKDHDKEVFAHLQCAVNAGMKFEELSSDRCCHCEAQFLCDETPEETCLLIELGKFEKKIFIAESRGAVHWACASRWWKEELFSNLEGTTDLI